jgi:hypothetical protein
MTIIMVCGYRRTGKDSLYGTLSGAKNAQRWRIYRNPNNVKPSFPPRHNTKCVRVAFADKLKEECQTYYQLPLDIKDEEKDTKRYIHPATCQSISARDIYIEWAAVRRNEDPEYWCKQVLSGATFPHICYIITDWRYNNEVDYVTHGRNDVVTVRVFRTAVPIPSTSVTSEHELDQYRTDVLLIGMDDDFAHALVQFPQYEDYVYCGMI